MTRSLAAVVAAAVLAGVVVGLAVDLEAGLLTVGLLAVLGAAAVVVAQQAVARRDRLGMLGQQTSLAVGIAAGQMLVAIGVAALLMVVSGDDVVVVAVVIAFMGLVAVLAARVFAAGVLRDIERIRDGLMKVGAGERDVRVSTMANDELAQLAQAANAMISQLKAEEMARDMADAARRHLVAAVSHDLRTPITSLQLLAEAVDDEIVDGETRRRYLAKMTTHIQALSALIDDLFELTRIEAGDIRWSVETVELDELVGETVAAMRVQGEQRGVRVEAHVAADLAPARANPEKVQRVLFNLIQNALRHTPADGSVTVRAEPAGTGELEVEVADTGTGIPEEDRAKIFDAFYRGGEDRVRSRDGAGLGLAISRAIVEAHGGRIWLADADRGTRVRFSLPVAELAGAGGSGGGGAG